MNEHDLIDRMRGLGANGPAPAWGANDLLPAGRRMRRRRAVLASGGVASVAGGVLTAALLFGSAPPADVVVSPAGDAPNGGEGAEVDAPKPANSPKKFDPNASEHNAALLQKVMGRDFEVVTGKGTGELKPGSPSAEGLPAGVEATVNVSAVYGTAYLLPQFCGPMVEKSMVVDGCVELTNSDGRTVYANWSRYSETGNSAGEQVRVLFQRKDGLFVYAQISAGGKTLLGSETRKAETREWLESYVDRLGDLVTDSDLESEGTGVADADPDLHQANEQPTAALEKAADICPGGPGGVTVLEPVFSSETPRSPLLAVESWIGSKLNNGRYKLSDLDRYRSKSYEKDGTWFYAALGENSEIHKVLTVRHQNYRFVVSGEIECR
ncbi:MAG: hypothetical protein ACT4QF_14730 [Sporichthyaceae bacterium]